MIIKWLYVFILAGVWGLAACTPAPLAEVAIPTPQAERFVGVTTSATATEEAMATTLPTETASPTPLAEETLAPLPPPPMIHPPYRYPDPNATPEPTATPLPTATPHYTVDGQWRIVELPLIGFQIPADWFVHTGKPYRLTNYPPYEPEASPVTAEPREEPYLAIEYYDIRYRDYTASESRGQGFETITAGGYPAIYHAEYSEAWAECLFTLTIEGPDQVHRFYLHHYMPAEPGVYEVAAALARGRAILQHIIETTEFFTSETLPIPIANQITITGTIASIEIDEQREFNQRVGTIYLEPSANQPYVAVRTWYGMSSGTDFFTYDGGTLLLGSLQPGDRLEIYGRPVSDTRLLGDRILVVQSGVQGQFTRPIAVVGTVVQVNGEFAEIYVAPTESPNDIMQVVVQGESALVLQNEVGDVITYDDISPNDAITVHGYYTPELPLFIIAIQVIVSP